MLISLFLSDLLSIEFYYTEGCVLYFSAFRVAIRAVFTRIYSILRGFRCRFMLTYCCYGKF